MLVNNIKYPFNEWTKLKITVEAVDWPRTIYIYNV